MTSVQTNITGKDILDGWLGEGLREQVDRRDRPLMLELRSRLAAECRTWHKLGVKREGDPEVKDMTVMHGLNVQQFMYDLHRDDRAQFWQELVKDVRTVDKMQWVISANKYIANAVLTQFGVDGGKSGTGMISAWRDKRVEHYTNEIKVYNPDLDTTGWTEEQLVAECDRLFAIRLAHAKDVFAEKDVSTADLKDYELIRMVKTLENANGLGRAVSLQTLREMATRNLQYAYLGFEDETYNRIVKEQRNTMDRSWEELEALDWSAVKANGRSEEQD